MKTYTVYIETRKGDDNGFLGPFSTFEKAQEALKNHCDWIDDVETYTDEFGSDFGKGCIYTEEESVEIIEREME